MKELLVFLYKYQEEREERGTNGKVIIQTYNPENFCIEHAKNQDYDSFYETEIALRKSLNYPPFCDIIMFGISGANEEEIIEASGKLYDILQNNVGKQKGINIFRAVPAPVSKIKNKHRWRIIVKCKLNNNTIDLINNTLEEYYKLKYKRRRFFEDSTKLVTEVGQGKGSRNKNITVVVDVNPNSLM